MVVEKVVVKWEEGVKVVMLEEVKEGIEAVGPEVELVVVAMEALVAAEGIRILQSWVSPLQSSTLGRSAAPMVASWLSRPAAP